MEQEIIDNLQNTINSTKLSFQSIGDLLFKKLGILPDEFSEKVKNEFDKYLRLGLEVFMYNFDIHIDNIIELLDIVKTFIILVQQEMIDLSSGKIVFTEKYLNLN